MEASWGLNVPGNEIAHATHAALPMLCNSRAKGSQSDCRAGDPWHAEDESVLSVTQLSGPLDRGENAMGRTRV